MLLDEIEKAHPDVFNILLQVLDDGRLTDGQGRTVDFRNTVVIMTSNLGSDLITGAAARSASRGSAARAARDAGRPARAADAAAARGVPARVPQPDRRDHRLPPAGRAEQLRQITGLLLEETRRRLPAQDIELEFTDAAVDWLAERGYQPEFGARPLRRTIQREVDNQLSRLLLDGQAEPGAEGHGRRRDGALDFDVSDRAPAPAGD